MGYYMRFILTDEPLLTLQELGAKLSEEEDSYISIKPEKDAPEKGDLVYEDELYGHIEINKPGDGLFDDELSELIEDVESAEGKGQERVLQVLKSAKAILAVQVLFQDRGVEDTLEEIDPIWKWLFKNRHGLLEAQSEGYYDEAGLILEVK